MLIELFGGGLALSTALKLGWFYELAFHRVGIVVSGTDGFEAHLSVAFLSGTAFAVWLLFRAGRSAGAATSASSVRTRVLAGAMVGPVYALPIVVISALVRVQLATGGALVPGTVRFEGVVWQAFVFPALLGAVAGGAGGALGVLRADARVSAWLIGGWRMLLAALGLAAVGILLLAAVRPQGLATYTRVVSANGARSALLLVGHHALVLPNQSFLVVAPSMGGCTSLSGPGGTVPLVCPGTLPALDDPALIPSVARADDDRDVARTRPRARCRRATGRSCWCRRSRPSARVGGRDGRGAAGPADASVRSGAPAPAWCSRCWWASGRGWRASTSASR